MDESDQTWGEWSIDLGVGVLERLIKAGTPFDEIETILTNEYGSAVAVELIGTYGDVATSVLDVTDTVVEQAGNVTTATVNAVGTGLGILPLIAVGVGAGALLYLRGGK